MFIEIFLLIFFLQNDQIWNDINRKKSNTFHACSSLSFPVSLFSPVFFLIKQDQKAWYQQVWSISLEEYIFVAFSERALLHRWKITKTYHATWKQSEIIAETPTSID